MELFRSPPKFAPSLALEEISSELACQEVAEEVPESWYYHLSLGFIGFKLLCFFYCRNCCLGSVTSRDAAGFATCSAVPHPLTPQVPTI